VPNGGLAWVASRHSSYYRLEDDTLSCSHFLHFRSAGSHHVSRAPTHTWTRAPLKVESIVQDQRQEDGHFMQLA